uniref:ATP-dependent DNA helicase n=1 Tax=Cyanothece sp. (strain PCC 7425 / ATCC 29141) TaxID=395961 RepID=B8HPM2_CYAP4
MTSADDFLGSLNPSQRQAVKHYCGPLLVVAGAGSGKTRALTYRIANLVLTHRIAPENILAVTFTNKAAREMKERIKKLFAEQQALQQYGQSIASLKPFERNRLETQVYKTIIRDLWIGTFHSLCARILRFEIEKYRDSKGRQWQSNFSIFDESDVQSLIKDIVVNQLQLDERKFEPRSVRYGISNAKNQGWSPQDLEREQPNFRGRVIANVYGMYQDSLAANNALDFDDLILMLVQLFKQNEQVLSYWHQRFHHILVDEYQDTNRTQYELIRLLATNGAEPQQYHNWEEDNRSIFVVGDVDQSIYSFRAADFKILLDFQQDFGDRLPDERTATMVKLEENYRSTENILQAANELIENNTERIDKVLKPTRGCGHAIYCHRDNDEIAEAEFVVEQIRSLVHQPGFDWNSFAILYRTNAQSRPFEEALVRWAIPYTVVGGLKFYDRKEIKDVLAYLRLIINPADSLSLLRVINTPRRGIGKTTLDRLTDAAKALGVPLWEIIQDETSVKTLAGRSAKPMLSFVGLIQQLTAQVNEVSAPEVVQAVLEGSGYLDDLKSQGTDEADERLRNVQELYNAVLQFDEESEGGTLSEFLAKASLASDLDDLGEGKATVSLMTLHSSKGLEFPVVFLVGLEQGLFPNLRALDDPASLEEERRLCYVGITRAQERLFISHVRERRLYGNREPASPSLFLGELPRDLLTGNGAGGMSGRSTGRSQPSLSRSGPTPNRVTGRQVSANQVVANPGDWQVGDRIIHPNFGPGQITRIFGQGNKLSLAIQFADPVPKIIDPKLIALQRFESN